MTDTAETPAHEQRVAHDYLIAYPEHAPRESDPHYVDFEAYRKRTVATAKCGWGVAVGDFSECGGGLELHHHDIEFALQNSVDLKHLEFAYPGVSNPNEVGAWVESGTNLEWLCQKHHIAAGAGVHDLSSSDYAASRFVQSVFSAEAKVI